MDSNELNKFVWKFKTLWNSGFDAHLDLDCHAGEAWIGLRLRLGDAGGVQQHPLHGKDSPAKQRRRERRAAERQSKSKEESVKVEKTVYDNTEEVNILEESVKDVERVAGELIENIDDLNLNSSNDLKEEVNDNLNESVIEIRNYTNDSGGVDNLVDELLKDVDVPISVNEDLKEANNEATENVANDQTDNTLNESKPSDEAVKPTEEVLVHATAVFVRSPTQSMTQFDTNFLEQIILREEHLRQNISKIEFGHLNRSQKFGENDFKHSIELRIFVRTQKLWETPRSYLYKFLGQFEWTKHDGTRVTMNRIHTKA